MKGWLKADTVGAVTVTDRADRDDDVEAALRGLKDIDGDEEVELENGWDMIKLDNLK